MIRASSARAKDRADRPGHTYATLEDTSVTGVGRQPGGQIVDNAPTTMVGPRRLPSEVGSCCVRSSIATAEDSVPCVRVVGQGQECVAAPRTRTDQSQIVRVLLSWRRSRATA